jgi:hypothetical protein
VLRKKTFSTGSATEGCSLTHSCAQKKDFFDWIGDGRMFTHSLMCSENRLFRLDRRRKDVHSLTHVLRKESCYVVTLVPHLTMSSAHQVPCVDGIFDYSIHFDYPIYSGDRPTVCSGRTGVSLLPWISAQCRFPGLCHPKSMFTV